MKLDGETVRCHGSVDLKSDQKPVEDKNNNGFIDSIKHRPSIEQEGKDHSGDFCKADQLQYTVNDLTSNDEEKLRDFVSPIQFTRSSLKSESFEKESVFYVDKSVMEPELPELVVCYKENTYHVVKDICVDEGIPAKDKFLFDTDVDEEQLRTFLKSEHKNSEILLKSSAEKENLGVGNHVTDVSMSSKEKGSRNEISGESDLNKSMAVMEKDGNGVLRETFSLGELLAMAAKPKSERYSTDRAEVQMQLKNTIQTRSHDSEESENVDEKTSSANPTTSCEAEKSGFECKQASLQISDSDKESNHGHDGIQLPNPPDSAAEKSEETLESQNTLEISESNRTTGDTSKSITSESNCCAPLNSGSGGTEPLSSQLQYSQGESSFSAGGPVSGLITYSGPIAYSGSLSLRSDSSTTSTRSFAFPILQSEWNSSPVRMAKADRRCNRKHGWRQAIMCCRF